jgi:hypothetical protein
VAHRSALHQTRCRCEGRDPAGVRARVQRVRVVPQCGVGAQLAVSHREATAAKLSPTLAKFDSEFDKLLQQRIDLQRQLDAAADIKTPRRSTSSSTRR